MRAAHKQGRQRRRAQVGAHGRAGEGDVLPHIRRRRQRNDVACLRGKGHVLHACKLGKGTWSTPEVSLEESQLPWSSACLIICMQAIYGSWQASKHEPCIKTRPSSPHAAVSQAANDHLYRARKRSISATGKTALHTGPDCQYRHCCRMRRGRILQSAKHRRTSTDGKKRP